MQSNFEKLEGLTCRLKVTVSSSEIEQSYEQQVQKIAKNIQLKGFRPGKVPVNVVKSRMGDQIQQEVVGEILQDTFQKAIAEHNLRVAGQPRILPKKLIMGQPFEYEALFEIFPEFQLKDLDGVVIEKVTSAVNDTEVEQMIEKIRREQADWVVVNREAREGDRLLLDFEGFVGDKPIEKGSAKNFRLVLGSKQMIPGFESSLIGAKAGQDLEIQVNFPVEYQHPDLAGKPATFKIKVHEVEEPKLPSIESDLPKKLQIQGGEQAVRSEVRKQMEKALKNNLDGLLRSRALEKLMELNPIPLPQGLIAVEIQYLQQLAQQEQALMKAKGVAPTDLPFEFYKEQAERRVRLGLLLADLIKSYQIQRDPEKIRQKINELTADFPNPEETAKWYYQNKQLLTEVETLSLEEQVVEKLLEKAQVVEKSMSYDEAMNINQ